MSDSDAAERVARALRAARDRKLGDERDYDFRRDLSVDGLQALEALLARVAAAERALEEERTLREQIEDDHWPYEWQVATAERSKRKAAEERAERAQEALGDIASGDWQRYPNRERHGQPTVEDFSAHELAALVSGQEHYRQDLGGNR